MNDVSVTGPMHDRYDEILTPDELDMLGALHREFEPQRRELI